MKELYTKTRNNTSPSVDPTAKIVEIYNVFAGGDNAAVLTQCHDGITQRLPTATNGDDYDTIFKTVIGLLASKGSMEAVQAFLTLLPSGGCDVDFKRVPDGTREVFVINSRNRSQSYGKFPADGDSPMMTPVA